MESGCYPLSSLTSILLFYPIFMIFNESKYYDFRHKLWLVYIIHVAFLSVLHFYFYEDGGILAFLDRWVARLGMLIFFICMISTKYYFGLIEKVTFICGIIFYVLCSSPMFNYKYSEMLHLMFRYCGYIFFTVFFYNNFKLKSSLYKHIKTLTILYVACIVIVFTLFYKLGVY